MRVTLIAHNKLCKQRCGLVWTTINNMRTTYVAYDTHSPAVGAPETAQGEAARGPLGAVARDGASALARARVQADAEDGAGCLAGNGARRERGHHHGPD